MNIKIYWAKITQYEYWTWWVFYLPMLPYWFYWAIKTRAWGYFSVVNPSIELGGFFGESKKDILAKIDKTYLPKHLVVSQQTNFDTLVEKLEKDNLLFPIVAKPNVGERGFQVEKITDKQGLYSYHKQAKALYIIQEYVDFEFELGVLYVKMPNETHGKVTSITGKEFLNVIGDGKSTIKELMQKNLRASMQIKRLENMIPENLQQVPAKNEKIILEPIGNHCRGTRFINYNHLINKQVNQVFDSIVKNIDGFYYGRFDLRVANLEDLQAGKNIKVLELNGVSSEPGHIYDATVHSVFSAYKDLRYHWHLIGKIALIQIKNGVKPVPFSHIVRTYLAHLKK